MIEIEVMPAESGDSFLLHFDNGKNILIDMGYKKTYKNHIRNRLLNLKKKNQCIDLLIITHIDEDHIDGAIEFLKENGPAQHPKIIEIKEIWYNSYQHLFKLFRNDSTTNKKLTDKQKIKLKNTILKYSTYTSNNEGTTDISAHQGDLFVGYLYKYGYEKYWNSFFYGNAISSDIKHEITFDGIKFLILSPNNNKLEILYKIWKKYLQQCNICPNINDKEILDEAYEIYVKTLVEDDNYNKDISVHRKSFKELLSNDIHSTTLDNSKSNGTSIAFIIEYKNKKLLFLADAHENIILDSLEKNKIINNENPFELIKIAHHGSIKNNFKWIDKIFSKKYLFSTDDETKNGHPSLEVIAKIVKMNHSHKKLYFNYDIETIKKNISNNELEKIYNYEVFMGTKKIIIGD